MARLASFFVQGFTDKLGALKAEAPTRCKDEAAALRAVARLGETMAGAIAFSSSGDADLGDFDDEPIVMLAVGRVPDNFAQ